MEKITHKQAIHYLQKYNCIKTELYDYVKANEIVEELLGLKNQKIELLEEIIKLNNGGIDIGSIRLIQHYRKLREIEKQIIDLEIAYEFGRFI